MLKLGSNSSITPAGVASADSLPLSWISGSGELTGCGWLQHHGDGQLRIAHRIFTRIEHTALDPRCPGLVQVRKGEIDSEVDLGGLLAIDVDSGEVKQDVDRHRHNGVRAGGSE